ncbi:tRNA uridine-5-carboxymethylaminomethyl(34) synthesis GTPase MnmE [Opitutus terrae]|uniref:tRNA modification GTPase MnmE n=1 Tax=Opitutus terrae (strain DSM 11246 / JCM 15787 / PB90-1) TaxID=452637 RepID=MNME_OPITP|nr:tRNA uridine-5-carboxymethylaminomethyl(34) synthesis GTPase MnmE [Opitutus terrae]B1ZWP5.1 RecName: Full=tRNA modification GTPase MnmE [Opitutus terrae PB90-1]ACB74172.1 tRNA modification GTPase TrmE [Opitutus terrae PB90-1]
MPPLEDTIAALATPAGISALAILRASGPDTRRIAEAILGRTPLPRRIQRVDYRDRAGHILDEVLCVFFPQPRSYTGEDLLEISTHGNPFIAQRVLQDLFARGCRPAGPGEFTQRAFLNGRLDLSQAEAVMDLIHAQSDRALAAANHQLRGSLGRHVQRIIDRVVRVLAQVEAYIDFPDEDLPSSNRDTLAAELEMARHEAEQLIATQRYGNLIRDGIKTVIVGAPNVGKSSLLNRLVGRERALVSAEPGTTRDFIEERIAVGEHCIRLVDTAGLNVSPAPLEALGIHKSLEQLADADLVLAIVDLSDPEPSLPPELAKRLDPKNTLLVANKIDLCAGKCVLDTVDQWFGMVFCSAKIGVGLDDLFGAIGRWADQWQITVGQDVIAVNARHSHALALALEALDAALDKLRSGDAAELLASDLRSALLALGDIAGRVDNERVLDELFATFCIGK